MDWNQVERFTDIQRKLRKFGLGPNAPGKQGRLSKAWAMLRRCFTRQHSGKTGKRQWAGAGAALSCVAQCITVARLLHRGAEPRLA